MDFFEPLTPEMMTKYGSAPGRFLIAEPCLPSAGFSRTVIFICEHNEYGTLGLVLNRPTPFTTDKIFPELELPVMNIYEGGPVQTGALQVLHRLPHLLRGSEILPGIFWGASYSDLEMLSEKKIKFSPHDLRLFHGYSGWEKGQLDLEMKEGSWITAPARETLIFTDRPDDLWSEALRQMGDQYTSLLNFPINPILN